MTSPERRETPRATIAGHAYINIEPNNGGMVLNVSDGGLCFHSFDPVERNGKVRFWLSVRNQKIEAEGTLAWMDETRKGGLRFSSLPLAAREQVETWIKHSSTAVATPPAKPAGNGRAVPVNGGAQPQVVVATAPPVQTAAVEPKKVTPVAGFSRGVLTGVLVSAAMAAVFLFANYRREFGESLIRLGERFAARPSVPVSATVPSTSATLVPASPPLNESPQVTVVRTPVVERPSPPPKRTQPSPAVAQPEKIYSPPARPVSTEASIRKPDQAPATEPTKPVVEAVAKSTAVVAVATPAPQPTVPKPVSSHTPEPVAAPAPIPTVNNAPTKSEAVNSPSVQTESSSAENSTANSQLFFEVGNC